MQKQEQRYYRKKQFGAYVFFFTYLILFVLVRSHDYCFSFVALIQFQLWRTQFLIYYIKSNVDNVCEREVFWSTKVSTQAQLGPGSRRDHQGRLDWKNPDMTRGDVTPFNCNKSKQSCWFRCMRALLSVKKVLRFQLFQKFTII